MKKYHHCIPPLIVICIFFMLWQGVASFFSRPFILPTPLQVTAKLIELKESLFLVHLPATLLTIVIGLTLSIVFGVGLAIMMNMNKTIEKAFYPIMIASQTIPIIALAPIFVLWFGYSILSKVIVTLLITFFPITVNVFDGFRSTNKDLQQLLLTMGASKKDIFFKLSIPTALPFFYSGLKVAVTLSVIGAAIGEWLGAEAGLGYFSRRMMTQFDGAGVFAPIVLLAAIGICLFLLVVLLEKLTLNWRNL